MKRFLLSVAAMFVMSSGHALAHCEIPCGVFDDGARFETILEHARTIEKSMHEINELSALDKPDYHSISRWTTNKEKHAQLVQNIASEYFLAQRVKVPSADAEPELQDAYQLHLTLLHQIIVKAMKTKQKTDLSLVGDLRDLTEAYKAHYFKKHGHEH